VLPCPASAPLSNVDEGLASSSANRVQDDDDSDVFAPLSLPVRQAFKQPVVQPRIHDVTAKFTRACEGAFFLYSFFYVAGFRCSEWVWSDKAAVTCAFTMFIRLSHAFLVWTLMWCYSA